MNRLAPALAFALLLTALPGCKDEVKDGRHKKDLIGKKDRPDKDLDVEDGAKPKPQPDDPPRERPKVAGPAVPLQEVLEGLPENARGSSVVRTDRANDWFTKNAVGRRMWLSCQVSGVRVTRESPFTAEKRPYVVRGRITAPDGGRVWRVEIGKPPAALSYELRVKEADSRSSESEDFTLKKLDGDTAEKIEGLQGKAVRLEGTVEEIVVGEAGLSVRLIDLAFDGIKPRPGGK